MKKLEAFLIPSQKELFGRLCKIYKCTAVSRKGSYILVRGQAPVMLVAHLDTVHHSPVREICLSQNGNILMSPQGIGGDDRCGVYALTVIYEKSEVKPWLLFTCDEETGGIGARKFRDVYERGSLPKELDRMKILVEIDRKGKKDAVYYNCSNPDFEAYITSKGFQTAWGSFSDISVIAPALGVAAVNLSSGYYNAHTLHEYINRSHLDSVIEKVAGIVADAARPDFPRYEYIDAFGKPGDWEGNRHRDWRKPAARSRQKAAGQMTEEEFLHTVPEDIREDYAMLLDYYTARELERLRDEYGDRVIPMLCQNELGGYNI